MTDLTPFEHGLIEHVRSFCRGYDSHGDQQTQAAIWLVMSSLREWEENGAEAALTRVQAAYEAKANRV